MASGFTGSAGVLRTLHRVTVAGHGRVVMSYYTRWASRFAGG